MTTERLWDDVAGADEWAQPSRGLVHELQHRGETDDWYTPPAVIAALGLTYDLDPASPLAGPVPWIGARAHLTERENGTVAPWRGRVWLNPPYGPQTAAFLARLEAHGNGVALVYARTETRWGQRAIAAADAVLFVAGRLPFVRPDGTMAGRAPAGSMLLGFGDECADAVRSCGLGWVAR